MSEGIELSKFNEGVSFMDGDIKKITEGANSINTKMHKFAQGDMEKYISLVYEVGIMLTSQAMSFIADREKMLPRMLKDVERDLINKLEFHDAVHKESEKS